MGPNPATFRRNVCLIAGAAVAVRLMIGLVSWRQLKRLDEEAARMSRGQEVLAALESVRSGLASAEASEAAYLVTGGAADLEVCGAAERATRRQLAHAWTLAADDETLAPRLTEVAKLVDRRFELSGIAQGARRAGFDEARSRVVLRVGRDATDKALAAVDEARAAQVSLLQRRAEAHTRALSRALTGIAAAAVGSILAVILVALWLLPSFDERVAAQYALRPEPAADRVD